MGWRDEWFDIVSVEIENNNDIRIIIDTDYYFQKGTYKDIIEEILLISCKNIDESYKLLSEYKTDRIEYFTLKHEDSEAFMIIDYYYALSYDEIICKNIITKKRSYSLKELKKKYEWAVTNYKNKDDKYKEYSRDCSQLITDLKKSIKNRIRISKSKLKGYAPAENIEVEKLKYKFLLEEYAIFHKILNKENKTEK